MEKYKIQAQYSTITNGEYKTINEIFFIMTNEDITFLYIEKIAKKKHLDCEFISLVVSQVETNSIMTNIINNN